MDNPEEVMQILERFNVSRNPEITVVLNEYIAFVARTGDSVYNWSLVKNLFREKLVNVITEFYNETPTKELPQYPNVDPFNYETMKKVLIEKLDSFAAAPFTIQRISELLSDPRKQYSRIDKFMRAVEKTILVVSTVPPGRHRSESENGDSLDSALNGDFATEVNVDVEMEQDGVTSKEPSIESKPAEVATVASPVIACAKNNVTQSPPAEGETSKESEAKVPTAEPILETKTVVKAEKLEDETKTDEKLNVPESPTVISSPIKEEVKTEVVAAAAEHVEVVVPKAQDDELSNKPIQPTDDHSVEASENLNEQTPLAALENIVAIRTETPIEAADVTDQNTVTVEPIENKAEAIEEVKEVADDATDSKRPKISESVAVPKSEVKTEEPVSETPAKVSSTEEATVTETACPTLADTQNVSLPIVEIPEVKPSIDQAVESIAEPEPVVEIPIEVSQATVNITEAQATEMETIPTTTETNNTMSLDEDEPPTIELEMTPVASKMDTDEIEAAPMECEDEAEPMDQ